MHRLSNQQALPVASAYEIAVRTVRADLTLLANAISARDLVAWVSHQEGWDATMAVAYVRSLWRLQARVKPLRGSAPLERAQSTTA